jgi:hypothetical protein
MTSDLRSESKPSSTRVPRARFSVHPRQMEALTTSANEVFFGGSVGGSKSHLLRVAAITGAISTPGLQVYLIRKHFGDLVANHMMGENSIPRMLDPFKGLVQSTANLIKFWNGSIIHLRHLEHDSDLSDFAGREIGLLLIDEATHFSEAAYRLLKSRCRVSGQIAKEGRWPRIIAAGTPGNVGHSWCKRTWVDAGPWTIWEAEGGLKRQYIPARLSDNPSLDADYAKRLEALGDPMLIKASIDGDWNIFAGSMFDEFRIPLHVVQPFSIPDHWPLWKGADNGHAAPFACLWCAQHPDTAGPSSLTNCTRPA